MSYAEKHAEKMRFGAYSPQNAPVGVHVGTVPAGDADFPEDAGKFIFLNSAMTPIRAMPCYESMDQVDRVLSIMTDIMIAEDAGIWDAGPRARQRLDWETEAETRGISVDDLIAEKEAERAREAAAREEARKIKEKTAALQEKGLKVTSKKGGTQVVLTADALQEYLDWVAENGAAPTKDFVDDKSSEE